MMVNIKPTLWKVIVSLLTGVIIALWNFYQGYKMYWTYENTPRLAQYGYSFWEIIIRNGFLSKIIWGFVLGIITSYLIYSLLQKEKSKWTLLWLFLLLIISFIINLANGFDKCFLKNNFGFFCSHETAALFIGYNLALLIYIGIKYISIKK